MSLVDLAFTWICDLRGPVVCGHGMVKTQEYPQRVPTNLIHISALDIFSNFPASTTLDSWISLGPKKVEARL